METRFHVNGIAVGMGDGVIVGILVSVEIAIDVGLDVSNTIGADESCGEVCAANLGRIHIPKLAMTATATTAHNTGWLYHLRRLSLTA
jgi:hypothetical protein